MSKILIDEATAEQVLEALELVIADVKTTPSAYEAQRQAITALQEALAKPDFWEGYVPEPVKPSPVPWSQALEDVWAEQPAQRTWVSLTDEDISWIAINTPPMVHEFARAIEAKLKEKNT